MAAYLKPFFRKEDFLGYLDSSECQKLADRAEALLEAAFGNEYQIVMFWKERLEAERREIERLREALPDPAALETLAKWVDTRFPDDANPEVQNDLRRWAAAARSALGSEENQKCSQF